MSDELDEGLDIEGSSFDDDKKEKTLGDLWRDNPLVKVGVIGVGVVAIFGTIMMFGGDEAPVDMSILPAGSEITAPPGTEEATPAYVAAVEEQNAARIEEAVNQGGSALPTPIDPPQGRLVVPEQEQEAEDPLQRWRQLQEERLQRELEQSQLQPAAVPQGAVEGEAVQALADAMAEQMQAILESRSESTVQAMDLTDPDFIENARKNAAAEANSASANNANGTSGGTEDGFFEDEALENLQTVLLPAGEIVYAQLLTEANTDVPGPVLAEIMSGPLAGSRVLGEFEDAEEGVELLTLRFDTIVYEGESFDIDAIALDPETTLAGMATDVDHRYLKRIILPMAAAFVEGAANAIAESGLTTISIQGETVAEETEETDSTQEIAAGVDEAGQKLGEILDEMAENTKILIRIRAGTPMGILFLAPVIEGGTEGGGQQGGQQQQQQGFNVSLPQQQR